MTRPQDQEAERAAEESTMLLFGPPPGIKIDPRFPMPVSVSRGGVTVHYISREEAANRESESEKTLREALEALADHAGKTWCAVCDDHAAGCDELRAARAALDSVRRVSIVDKNR